MFSVSWVDRYGQAAQTMFRNDEGMEGVEQPRRCSKARVVGKRAGAKEVFCRQGWTGAKDLHARNIMIILIGVVVENVQ
jgi:hypothetical protein